MRVRGVSVQVRRGKHTPGGQGKFRDGNVRDRKYPKVNVQGNVRFPRQGICSLIFQISGGRNFQGIIGHPFDGFTMMTVPY